MLAAGRPYLAPAQPAPAGSGDALQDARDGLEALLAREVLIALEKAAVLVALGSGEAGAERRVVWEIGAWGPGQAVALKRLFPDLRYVLTDRPDPLFRAAQALVQRFPGATVHLHAPGVAPDWDADFLFFPIDTLAELRPPRPDLALSVLPHRRFGGAGWQLAEVVKRLGLRAGTAYAAGHLVWHTLHRAQGSQAPEAIALSGTPASVSRYQR